ncbi:MAG: hypothetical protein ACO37F_14790, partial [Pirellulales bacterium]
GHRGNKTTRRPQQQAGRPEIASGFGGGLSTGGRGQSTGSGADKIGRSGDQQVGCGNANGYGNLVNAASNLRRHVSFRWLRGSRIHYALTATSRGYG